MRPGSREVAIDVPASDPPPVVPQKSDTPKKNSAKPMKRDPQSKRSTITPEQSKSIVNSVNSSDQFFSSEVGTKPVLKQQMLQNIKVINKGGSETLDGYRGRGTSKVQRYKYPRGPFSPVTRSLERHYSRGTQRTTFGQDLSNMISNWGN